MCYVRSESLAYSCWRWRLCFRGPRDDPSASLLHWPCFGLLGILVISTGLIQSWGAGLTGAGGADEWTMWSG